MNPVILALHASSTTLGYCVYGHTTEPPTLRTSLAEAARHIGLGRTNVYQLVDAGTFPHKRSGRCLRFPVKALEQ
jgi:excisionase family DNA binding protein